MSKLIGLRLWTSLSVVAVFSLALGACSDALKTNAGGASGADSRDPTTGGAGEGGVSTADGGTGGTGGSAAPDVGSDCSCTSPDVAEPDVVKADVATPDAASVRDTSVPDILTKNSPDGADSVQDGGTSEAGAHAFVSMVALGHASSCAVVDGAVKCWGWNGYGQLGDGTTENRRLPVPVKGLSAGATALATGLGHACAVSNGGVQCWGWNSEGQLGNGTKSDSPAPVQVSGLTSGVTAIAAGAMQIGGDGMHVCAVVAGAVKCWGNNMHGQLGNNTTVGSSVPVQVQGITSGATAIAVSDNHSCAIVDGGARCWGWNGNGQLGDGTTTKSTVPVQVQGLTSGVTAISAGAGFTCAVVNGGVQCWGGNELYSTLGSSTVTDSGVPIQCDGMTSGVSTVSAGYIYGCAIIGGVVRCWGDWNPLFVPPRNGETGRASLVQVPNITSGTTAIATADTHACAIVDNSLQCWGDNFSGELGNNSTTDGRIPAQVQFP